MLRNLCWVLVLSFSASCISAREISGRVVDAATGQPIPNAIVTAGATVTRTNAKGIFDFQSSEKNVAARAYGYGRTSAAIDEQHTSLERLTRAEVESLGISAYVAETVDEKQARIKSGKPKPLSLAAQGAMVAEQGGAERESVL